ncbi:tetraspanin-2A [Anopheles cruzii]|uniref:tetraspanin-2A n=1 Tax=Anopheles cruzii TaxID=68878 RepID=UPI0022EC564E|nr:tetraspanin-2A [Anopheles cruzii]
MARGEGKGESVARLSNQIACIKYTLFCFNIVAWFIGTQVLLFVLTVIGSAILLDFSTMNSSIQPLIRHTMLRFIVTSEHPHSSAALKLIQESIGCCGADGPNDYMVMRQPLPLECRDTVTGNAFFHGCVNELTWFLEDKSVWAAIMAMILAAVHTCNGVLGIVLVQALKREEEAMNRR